jgi:hypothetical protein
MGNGDPKIGSSGGPRIVTPHSESEPAAVQKDEEIRQQSESAKPADDAAAGTPEPSAKEVSAARLAELNLGAQLQEILLREKEMKGPMFSGQPGGVSAQAVSKFASTPVDKAIAQLTSGNVTPDDAAAIMKALSPAEQKQLANQMVQNHPKEAAEFANQLGQAKDPSAAKEFWKHTQAWITETVSDGLNHSQLPNARAFMDEVALLQGPAGKATKARANRIVVDMPFTDEFARLSKKGSGGPSSIGKAELDRALLHLDTWRMALGSGEKPDLKAMARRDPESFVRTVDSLKGDKKAYDAALDLALKQPSVDYTGRGVSGNKTTDPYMENLHDAVAKYGSPTLKADFALKTHEGGSFRPGYDEIKKSRRDLMADPQVLSILLHEKAEAFSVELRDMIKNDPARAQKIIAAGVAGYTLDYQKAMSKKPPDKDAAKAASYDLGLLLGETKEAAKEAFVGKTPEGYNFLEGIFKLTANRIKDLVPGGNVLADIGKDVLDEISGHFIGVATKFKEDSSGKKIEDAVDKFVAQMFKATSESIWSLRDPDNLREKVKQSAKLDAIKTEVKQFTEWLEAGYVAGQDSESNAVRSR